MHVENGLGERETFRVVEFEAYYRRVRERFLAAIADEPETYGWPTGHCGICDFRHMCWQQRVDDDHLSLVAGLRRAQAETLIATGVTTLEQLGDLAPATLASRLPPDANADSFEGARHQAELQLRGRREDRYLFELLPDEEERGFRLLPAPDAGDVWFDMEGHPFYETSRGLEYLFGYCFRNDEGEVVYDAVWGRDRDDERIAFEQFVDWVVARRAQHPGMHVYHYAAYERSALTRLAGQHGTREQEVDDFLRQEVLVDLYRIVKQSLRASTDSYSIKAIEKLYGFERTAEVAGGDESVVRFEEWVETGDDSILEEVERYNEEDCRSTYELHEWLRSIRPADRAVAAASRPAPADGRGRGARCRTRGPEGAAARRRRGGRAAAAAREPARLPPARGAARVVGVVPLAAARRRRARSRPHRDRRARVGRQSARGRGTEPRLPDGVPAAGAQDQRDGVRSPHACELPRPGRRRQRHRHRAARRQSRGRAPSAGPDARRRRFPTG